MKDDSPHAPPLRGSLPPEGAGLPWGGPAAGRSAPHPMRVAVIGAGNMGGAMAARLCEGGVPVVACDVDPLRQQQARASGALLADTPALAAAALGDDGLLIVCVVDADQSRAVLFGPDGAAHHLRPGQAVMLCPTIAPQDTEALAAALSERGIGCIDAPMSGGPARARDGSMSLMLAGPSPLLARHEALLARLSSRRFVISERLAMAPAPNWSITCWPASIWSARPR